MGLRGGPLSAVKASAMSVLGTAPSSLGYIVSVFPLAGMCSGTFEPRVVAGQLQQELDKHGLELTAWEPVHEADCFALLVSARARPTSPIDLLSVRRTLSQQLAPQQLQVRIQREDVFLAMHRL